MFYKSVPQECPTRVSHKSVLQECPTRVSHKSDPQECATRVSYRVSRKSVLQECHLDILVFRTCLHSGSWVPFCFWKGFYVLSLSTPYVVLHRNYRVAASRARAVLLQRTQRWKHWLLEIMVSIKIRFDFYKNPQGCSVRP